MKVRRLRRVVIFYFILAVLATIWPVYPVFSRIRPIILGLPFSLFFLVVITVVSFLVLVGLYLVEERQNGLE